MAKRYKGVIITLIVIAIVSLLGITVSKNNKVESTTNKAYPILYFNDIEGENDFWYRLSNLPYGEEYDIVFSAKEYKKGLKVNEYELLNLHWSQGEDGIPIYINYEPEVDRLDLEIKAGPAKYCGKFNFLNTKNGVAFSTPNDINESELNKEINILACSTSDGKSVESFDLKEYESINDQDLIISLEVRSK